MNKFKKHFSYLYEKIPRGLKNFYALFAIVFLVWMLFLDDNDLFSQYALHKKEKELLESKVRYEKIIKQVKQDKEKLSRDKKLLEKIAREKYLMKKDNEDLYIMFD